MLRPGRKAAWAGSRIECSSRTLSRRVASILLTRRAMVGPTDIGRMNAVESRGPSKPGFGSPDTRMGFSCGGRSRARRQRLTISVTMKDPAHRVYVTGLVRGVDEAIFSLSIGIGSWGKRDVWLSGSGVVMCVGSLTLRSVALYKSV